MVKGFNSSPSLELRGDILGSVCKVLQSDSQCEHILEVCTQGLIGRNGVAGTDVFKECGNTQRVPLRTQ